MLTFDFINLLYHHSKDSPLFHDLQHIKDRVILFQSTFQTSPDNNKNKTIPNNKNKSFYHSQTSCTICTISPAQLFFTPNELTQIFYNSAYYSDMEKLGYYLVDLKYFDLTPFFSRHFRFNHPPNLDNIVNIDLPLVS